MKTKLTYNCPQEVLYTVALMAWEICRRFLTQFAGFKEKYTTAYINAAVTAITDARALTPVRQRNAASRETRIELEQATAEYLKLWQLLKRYITDAFPKELLSAKLEAAGAGFYHKASADNWSASRSLLDAASSFITDNLAQLTAGKNMPVNFPAKLADAADVCLVKYKKFYNTGLDNGSETKDKVAANNAIYQTLIDMLKDGQRIFIGDAAAKQQFVFRYLVAVATGHGFASMRGVIRDAQTNVAVEGVKIYSVDGTKHEAITDAKGNYKIPRLAAGNYTFVVEKPGFQPQELAVTIRAAIANKLNVFITAAESLMIAA